MSGKYGFSGSIGLPAQGEPAHRAPVDRTVLKEAVRAGNELGFVDREAPVRRKPGPKRTEPQDKVSIPGPKRVIDQYRDFCIKQDVTLWRGLEILLSKQQGRTAGRQRV